MANLVEFVNVNSTQTTQVSTESSLHPPFFMANTESIWQSLRKQTETAIIAEPILAAVLRHTILDQPDLESAVAERVASKLEGHGLSDEQLREILNSAYHDDHKISHALACDLEAIAERDPAADDFLEPLMFYKGFHAISAYRASNHLWKQGRKTLARLLQSMISEALAVDIHPAATIGCGILLDHATSFVAGETAIIEDHVSILHEVTLGGTGKEHGARHPVVKSNVLIGAGAKILGRVTIGEGAKIGSGSVVLRDVAAHTTVVGVPAQVVGEVADSCPADHMDHGI